jgi:hypothetical protein
VLLERDRRSGKIEIGNGQKEGGSTLQITFSWTPVPAHFLPLGVVMLRLLEYASSGAEKPGTGSVRNVDVRTALVRAVSMCKLPW